jgi:protein phosphatase
MNFTLDAACLCNTGKVRKRNEDNFYFNGRCLEPRNNGLKHPVLMTKPLSSEQLFAIFDGMGGENFGDCASYAAVERLKSSLQKINDFYIPEKRFLNELCEQLNQAVVEKQEEFCTEHMGTTLVALYFSQNYVYVCNLGDSRAYRLREGEFLQLSKNHVELREGEKKGPLTQHLGIRPEIFQIEPYIAKGELRHGDQYLLCSDGLTDMLTNIEIDGIMSDSVTAEECAQRLVDAALEKGGRDNVTVIVCRVV